MSWKRIYLIILAVLLAALTALLSAAAIRIWQEGSARKAENPLAAVYTPENVAAELHRISPLMYTVIGLAAVGLLLGIRDEKSTRPVPAPKAEKGGLRAPAVAGKQSDGGKCARLVPALKAEKGGPQVPAAAGGPSDRGIAAARVLLLLAAGAFIVLGVLNESMEDVLRKAINLCTECIGLG